MSQHTNILTGGGESCGLLGGFLTLSILLLLLFEQTAGWFVAAFEDSNCETAFGVMLPLLPFFSSVVSSLSMLEMDVALLHLV